MLESVAVRCNALIKDRGEWCLEPESNRYAPYAGKRRILSPLCLPIPPSRPLTAKYLEARAGVEPTYTDLQSGA